MTNYAITLDFEAREPYITPERDEQGVFYGYKVLVRKSDGKLYSPVYPVAWNEDGSLDADKCPSENNLNGIYFCKQINDQELIYLLHTRGSSAFASYFSPDIIDVFIVKCALSGTVIEGETGFRVEHAQIVEICNGNRKNSQDSYGRAEDNSRPDSTTRKSYSKGWGESPITRSPWDISS